MQETLSNNPKVYLLIQLDGSRWEKKKSMKTEMTALANQRQATNQGGKERADTDLEFSSQFSLLFLICLSAGSCLV